MQWDQCVQTCKHFFIWNIYFIPFWQSAKAVNGLSQSKKIHANPFKRSRHCHFPFASHTPDHHLRVMLHCHTATLQKVSYAFNCWTSSCLIATVHFIKTRLNSFILLFCLLPTLASTIFSRCNTRHALSLSQRSSSLTVAMRTNDSCPSSRRANYQKPLLCTIRRATLPCYLFALSPTKISNNWETICASGIEIEFGLHSIRSNISTT